MDYKFINKYPKENIYKVYLQTGLNSKSYDEITRVKMIKVIYQSIVEDSDFLEGYLDKLVLEFFVRYVKEEIQIKNLSKEEMNCLLKLENSYLIYFDNKLRKYIVPDEIEYVVKKYKISDTHNLMDEFYDFISGLLSTRGMIPEKEAGIIYEKL